MPAALILLGRALTLHLQFQPLESGVDPFFEFRGIQPANGVLDDDQVRIKLPRLGLRQYKRPKGF